MIEKHRLMRLLKRVVGIVAVSIVAAGAAAVVVYVRLPQSNVGELSFANPLAIPDELAPRTDDEGRLIFDLTISAGSSEFIAGKQTPTWGINGPYLGPTLRANRGDEVVLNVTNDVGEPTTLHWHGMHLPAVMDGGPHQMIEPSATWSPTWTIDQPAATLWFHPHLMGRQLSRSTRV